jgi:hypothetical protein
MYIFINAVYRFKVTFLVSISIDYNVGIDSFKLKRLTDKKYTQKRRY